VGGVPAKTFPALGLPVAALGVMGAMALWPAQSFAACAPATGSNITVSCTGATSNQGPGINTGYGDATQDGVSLTVQSAASVTGVSTGIYVNNNNTITNLGVITTLGSGGVGDVFGISAGAGLTVSNSGTIGRVDVPDNIFDLAGINVIDTGLSVTNNAGGLIQGNEGILGVGVGTVVNSGTIDGASGGGGGDGINFFENNTSVVTVTNNTGGLITGDGNGITASGAVVFNHGTISAPVSGNGGAGINADTLTLTNYAGGVVSGDGFGVSGSSSPVLTITNMGTISATGVAGVAVEGNTVTITNSGTISALDGGSGGNGVSTDSGSITNNVGGVISSDSDAIIAFHNTSVFNAGTISATSGPAIFFTAVGGGGGGNTLTLGPGSVINGQVIGSGTDSFQLGGAGAATFDVSGIGPSQQYQGFATFTKVDASTWTLTGTTATVTPWVIDQGILAVSSDGNLGNASGGLTLAGGLLETTASLSTARKIILTASGSGFLTDAGTTLTVSGPISGTAGLIKSGGGELILGVANSYLGGTTLSGGALGVGDASALGPGALAMASGTTLQATAGGLTLANAITMSGPATVDTQANALTLAGGISGAGGLTKAGTGTLTLGGASSYTGATNVSAGVLQAGTAGAFAPASAFTVASGATLDIHGFDETIGSLASAGLVSNSGAGLATLTTGGDNTSTTYSGVIQDDGPTGFTKTGSGVLTLSGVSTYTGPTLVEDGTLIVDGSIASSSSLTIASGAKLGGAGTIGNFTAPAGATVAPGAATAVSTLHVAGNVGFLAGSTYVVNIDPTGANDAIAATGKATLSGGTVDVLAAGGAYSTAVRYNILSAGQGVSGTFAALTTTTNLAFLSPTLSYDANDVFLSLTPATTPIGTPVTFPSVAVAANQATTAAAIQALGPGSPVYEAVLVQSVAGARQAFDALSGEIHASAISSAFEDTRLPREAILDRTSTAPGAAPGLVAWGQAFGSWGRFGDNGNAAGVKRSLGGFVLGADTALGAPYRLGLAAGFTESALTVEARDSSGRVDSTFVSVYGGANFNALRLSGGAMYAFNRYGSQRGIAFPGFTDAADAGYGGDTLQAFGEARWRIRLPDAAGQTSVEPFVGGLAMQIHTDAFAESGGAPRWRARRGTMTMRRRPSACARRRRCWPTPRCRCAGRWAGAMCSATSRRPRRSPLKARPRSPSPSPEPPSPGTCWWSRRASSGD
jgi:outer membrane autotransporter protein